MNFDQFMNDCRQAYCAFAEKYVDGIALEEAVKIVLDPKTSLPEAVALFHVLEESLNNPLQRDPEGALRSILSQSLKKRELVIDLEFNEAIKSCVISVQCEDGIAKLCAGCQGDCMMSLLDNELKNRDCITHVA